MEPVTTAAIIAGAASAIGSGANAYAQGKMNRKTLKYNKWAMDKQRKWALEDWDRQNAYNSPAQQMQRLKEAGLNPHLIYGSGNPTQNAAPIDSTPVQSWNPQSVNWGDMLASPVNAYLETQSKVADQKLINAQTLKTLSEVNTKNFDLSQKEKLASTQEQILKLVAQGKAMDIQFTSDENARRAATTASNLNEASQRIAKSLSDIELQEMMKRKGNEEIKSIEQMRKKVSSEIEAINKDNKIRDFEISLNKMGFTKSDPVYFRSAKLIADAAGLTQEELKAEINQIADQAKGKVKEVKNMLNKIFSKNFWLGGSLNK